MTAALAASAFVLAGCSGGGTSSSSGAAASSITIGTTDKITTIDPAGSYDNGSFAVENQIYPFLMNTPLGSPDVKPDIAVSAAFTSPTEYTIKLKPGLKFVNGDDLTSSDVKFSFDRVVKIADENGPSSLLGNSSRRPRQTRPPWSSHSRPPMTRPFRRCSRARPVPSSTSRCSRPPR